MENSQGDKVPIKTVIGPPLAPGGAVPLNGLRESSEVREVVGDPSLPLPTQEEPEPQQEVCSARQSRRNTSEVCKDLEAHLRGLSSEDASLLETRTTHLESPVQGAEDAESLSNHAVALGEDGDTELKASFDQDFGEQRSAGSPVPELPPLEEPDPWQPSDQRASPPCHSSRESSPCSFESAGSDAEPEEDSSPFEELMLPPADFDYRELISGPQWAPQECAHPQWQGQEALDTHALPHSSAALPLQTSDVHFHIVEQQAGDMVSPGETTLRQLLFEPRGGLSAPWTEVSLTPVGPQIKLDEESDAEVSEAALMLQVIREESEEACVVVQEPRAEGYARLVPPGQDTDTGTSAATHWCCSMRLCPKRKSQQ